MWWTLLRSSCRAADQLELAFLLRIAMSVARGMHLDGGWRSAFKVFTIGGVVRCVITVCVGLLEQELLSTTRYSLHVTVRWGATGAITIVITSVGRAGSLSLAGRAQPTLRSWPAGRWRPTRRRSSS